MWLRRTPTSVRLACSILSKPVKRSLPRDGRVWSGRCGPADRAFTLAGHDSFFPQLQLSEGPADRDSVQLVSIPRDTWVKIDGYPYNHGRAKINAAIRGAQIWLEMRDNGEDFSAWLWSFVGGAPIQNDWSNFREAPVKTPESEAMAKALKKRGFNFCGPVIVYAFMQAVGMVNDHQTTCFRHKAVRAMARP